MSAVTSKLNQISIGEGKNKKTIFTGTTITPTTNADGSNPRTNATTDKD